MEIRSKTDTGRWAYVASEENVADLGTRGLSSKALSNDWFYGPAWLADDTDSWPVEFYQFDDANDFVFQVETAD